MKEQTKANTITNRFTAALFIIYLIALYWILILKLGVQFSYMGERRTNLIPFREPSILTSENILNVVVFVPLGLYVGILFKRWSFSKQLLFVFLLSLLVEGLQYLLRIGAFDVTDIVTNTSGGVIGLLIFTGTEKAVGSRVKAQKLVNIIAATGTVVILVLLVLLKANMLPVRYQ